MSAHLRRCARVAILVLLVLHGCGPSAKQKTIRTTLVSVNAARDGFLAWDAQKQQDIVAASLSRKDGVAKLETHRTKRSRVVAAFEVAYRVLAIAAMNPEDANVIELLVAAKSVYQAIEDLKGSP